MNCAEKVRVSAKGSDAVNKTTAHPNAVDTAGEGGSGQVSPGETHPQVGEDSPREDSRRSSFIMPTYVVARGRGDYLCGRLKLCDKAEHRSVSEPIKIFLNAGRVPYEFELMQVPNA